MPHSEKISLTINVDKIDKKAIFQGKKGRYITLTVIPTPDNQFGDEYMCTQYLKGEKGPILGNGKDLVFEERSSNAPATDSGDDGGDDLPF